MKAFPLWYVKVFYNQQEGNEPRAPISTPRSVSMRLSIAIICGRHSYFAPSNNALMGGPLCLKLLMSL